MAETLHVLDAFAILFAKDTAAAVLTADRSWSSLKLPGVHVSPIR